VANIRVDNVHNEGTTGNDKERPKPSTKDSEYTKRYTKTTDTTAGNNQNQIHIVPAEYNIHRIRVIWNTIQTDNMGRYIIRGNRNELGNKTSYTSDERRNQTDIGIDKERQPNDNDG
jgi:hypothetical protein